MMMMMMIVVCLLCNRQQERVVMKMIREVMKRKSKRYPGKLGILCCPKSNTLFSSSFYFSFTLLFFFCSFCLFFFSLLTFFYFLVFLFDRIQSLSASLHSFTKQKKKGKSKMDIRGRGQQGDRKSSVAVGNKHRLGRTTKKQRRKRTGRNERSRNWAVPHGLHYLTTK